MDRSCLEVYGTPNGISLKEGLPPARAGRYRPDQVRETTSFAEWLRQLIGMMKER